MIATKTVKIKKLKKCFRGEDYDIDIYLNNALWGKISPLEKKQFLWQMKECGRVNENFWRNEKPKDEKITMKMVYERTFSDLFFDGQEVNIPMMVEEVLENLEIDELSYKEKYKMPKVTNGNLLEVICHIIENLTEGELSKELSKVRFVHKRKQEIWTFVSEKEKPVNRKRISFERLVKILETYNGKS
ncbi:MAG: hypothetical protein ACTTKP_04050 [Catonella sp.]|uniref:hypothetical protein n=1 Tax=Catonella sp. TaxID=2382125 RepID=UPI003FA15246